MRNSEKQKRKSITFNNTVYQKISGDKVQTADRTGCTFNEDLSIILSLCDANEDLDGRKEQSGTTLKSL